MGHKPGCLCPLHQCMTSHWNMIMARSLKTHLWHAFIAPPPPKKKTKKEAAWRFKNCHYFPGPLVHRREEGSKFSQGMNVDLVVLKDVLWSYFTERCIYIYLYTHTVYPLACNRHRWFRMLDVSIDFCVAQHFSLAQQLDLPILNMTKAPVAHGHNLGTDWPTCMISTNTEDTVDGKDIWKKSG